MRHLTCVIFLFQLTLTINVVFGQDGYVSDAPKLAYWRLENPGKPTVVVIHGGPGVSHNYLRPEWDRLRDYATVVFYDQRGSGKSEQAVCYSWREHVRDLERLIETVSPNEKVFLAGTSWGVDLALLFTHLHSKTVRGLILSGITPWKGKGYPKEPCQHYAYNRPNEAAIQNLKNALTKNATMLRRDTLLAVGTPREKMIKAKKNIQGSDEIQFETLNSLPDAPTFDELSITVPSLIFQGAVPCHFPDLSKKFSDKIKGARIVYVDEACHDPWMVNPHRFFSECGRFIEQIGSYKN